MYSKSYSIISKALWAFLFLGGGYIALKFLLPWTLPLLLAASAAVFLERPVKWLCGRGVARAAASGICVLAALGICGGLGWILVSRLAEELGQLRGILPLLASAVSEKISLWNARLDAAAGRLPTELRQALPALLSGAAEYLERLPAALSEKAVELAAAVVKALPDMLLFAVTLVMGLYFISSSYPGIRDFLKRQMRGRSYEKLKKVKADLQRSVGKYFKAQLIMMVITFFELLAVFAFMRLDYALVAALATAVIDALPVFGAGTVLLPWAAWELLAGDGARGAALALCYGGVTLLRSCIQAKLLGDQLGLHPLLTLLSIYAGWKIWGVAGMVVFPIAAISLKRLNDSGLIHLWNTEDENDRSNIQYSGGHGNEHSGRNEYPSG